VNADDVFVDTKRNASCELREGVIDVLEQAERGYRRLARVRPYRSAELTLRSRLDRPLVSAGGVELAGKRFGCSVPPLRWVRRVAALLPALLLSCLLCCTGLASVSSVRRGTDAARGRNGWLEIRVGGRLIPREAAERALFGS